MKPIVRWFADVDRADTAEVGAKEPISASSPERGRLCRRVSWSP